jgi:glycosyltransferase involved in cell wall biosynthesis
MKHLNRKSKEIVMVGPLPPPYNGLSIAFKMLVDGVYKNNLSYIIVNIANTSQKRGGATSYRRAIQYLSILKDYFKKIMFGKKTVYITIAQSRHGFFRDFVMIWLAFFKGHNIVCHLHGGNYDNFYSQQPYWLKFLIRKTLLRVDKILVLGERLVKMFDFEPRLRKKIYIVPNGLPISGEINTKPKKLPSDSNEPIEILYLSNLIESKGYLDVLEAIGILVREYKLNIRAHFCGEFASYIDDVKVKSAEHGQKLFNTFISEHKLKNNVFYHGVVSGSEKLQRLEKAHFFVLPTNYINEGQPMSIIEAMAYGNVVISTDYRAIPDMVLDKKTGFLVPYNEPASIAKVIYDLVQKPDVYENMSYAAIQHVKSSFTESSHLNRILPLLKD